VGAICPLPLLPSTFDLFALHFFTYSIFFFLQLTTFIFQILLSLDYGQQATQVAAMLQ